MDKPPLKLIRGRKYSGACTCRNQFSLLQEEMATSNMLLKQWCTDGFVGMCKHDARVEGVYRAEVGTLDVLVLGPEITKNDTYKVVYARFRFPLKCPIHKNPPMRTFIDTLGLIAFGRYNYEQPATKIWRRVFPPTVEVWKKGKHGDYPASWDGWQPMVNEDGELFSGRDVPSKWEEKRGSVKPKGTGWKWVGYCQDGRNYWFDDDWGGDQAPYVIKLQAIGRWGPFDC